MNPALKKTKSDVKSIEKFCNSRPMPSQNEMENFLKQNDLKEFEAFAKNYLESVYNKEFILHTKKINKSRWP